MDVGKALKRRKTERKGRGMEGELKESNEGNRKKELKKKTTGGKDI